MTITLGSLRDYATDMAGDASDRKATRVVLRIVNDALRRVRTAHDWKRFKKQRYVPMDAQVDGTDVSVSSGGQLLTFGSGETADPKYVTESWDLLIASDPRLYLKIREVGSPPTTALLRSDQEWVLADATSSSYQWNRSVYDLPGGALKISRIEIHDTRQVLGYLSSVDFDNYKQFRAGVAQDPERYTLREGRLEVWPPLSTSPRRTLLVSYETETQTFTAADPDSTEVDWRDAWRDLIERAIDAEVAAQFSKSTNLDPFLTERRYDARLREYKGLETDRSQPHTGMTLGGASVKSERQIMKNSRVIP